MACPTAEPQVEHRWLDRMLGEWTFEGETLAGPDLPPETFSGVEQVRSLGGLWVVAEGRGAMPGGGTASTLLILGYDPLKERYVGTFVASMMAQMWVYEGQVETDETTLTLNTEGPNFATEGKDRAKFQDIVTFDGNDHRVLTSRMKGDDGQWMQVMRADYWRKSAG